MVDVFTSRPLLGNPVAVILDADGLDALTMQAIARWTNLSETSFLLPPTHREADYRLRIFTPGGELPFAGHPTLGSAHAALEAARVAPRQGARLVQQCDVGLVEVIVSGRNKGDPLFFCLPASTIDPLAPADLAELESILGCKGAIETAPGIVNVGAVWLVLHMRDATTVLGLPPDLGRLAAFDRRLGLTGVTVFGARNDNEANIEVRTFAPSCGVDEDPVCGSGNGSVAAFRWARGLLPREGCEYTAAQGRMVGRDGRIRVSVDETGRIRVGGACVTCVDGTLVV